MEKPLDDSTGGPPVVDVDLLIDGYQRAYQRFLREINSTDPRAIYRPLFEALAWTYSVDQRLGRPDHPELRGLRFARNRVHHQWADALYVTEGAVLPRMLPMALFEWRWRAELPPGRRSGAEPIYRDHLAEKPARATLDAVAQFLGPQ